MGPKTALFAKGGKYQGALGPRITWRDTHWTKKTGIFDVGIGSFDGAETCNLVGLFLLHHIKTEFPNENIGLYRDDGIGVTMKNGHQASTLEKGLHALFKRFNLRITTEINVKKTDFLDAVLDLNNGTIAPYKKVLDQLI